MAKDKEFEKIEEILLEEEYEDDLEDLDDLDDLDDSSEKKSKRSIDDFEFEFEDDDDYTELTSEDRIENIEKKMNIVMVLVIITLLFSAINTIIFLSSDNDSRSVSNTTASKNESTGSSATYDISAFEEIAASDIASKSKSEAIVIWIGRQGCGYCQQYAPIIASVGESHNMKIRYIDLGKIVEFNTQQPYVKDEDSWKILNSLTGSGEWKDFVPSKISGTPLTFIVKNNKVIGGLTGYGEEEQIEEMLKNAGLSK